MITLSPGSPVVRVAGASASMDLVTRPLDSASLFSWNAANTVAETVADFDRRGLDSGLLSYASVARGKQRLAATKTMPLSEVDAMLTNTKLAGVWMAGVAVHSSNPWLDHRNAVPLLLAFLLAALPRLNLIGNCRNAIVSRICQERVRRLLAFHTDGRRCGGLGLSACHQAFGRGGGACRCSQTAPQGVAVLHHHDGSSMIIVIPSHQSPNRTS